MHYQVKKDGDHITLSGGVFPEPRTFTLAPGSQDTVKALQQKEADDRKTAAAHQAQEDAQWQKRIPLAPINPSWHIGAVGEVPADPKPGHHFDQATVFKGIEGYTRTAILGGSAAGQTAHTTRWYFLPDGRFYADWSVQALANSTHPGGGPNTWGAYKILPGENEDTVQLETDRGEHLALKLEHGRQDLVFGESAFEQVQAANDALDRLLDSLK